MQEPCSRPLLPRRGRLRRSTARMRGLGINSIRRGQGLYNRDNAVLERALGNKGRAVMTVPELEAALAWLERDRLADDKLQAVFGKNRVTMFEMNKHLGSRRGCAGKGG